MKKSLKPFHIVFIAGEDEYKSELTLPLVAKDVELYGAKTTVLKAFPNPSNTSNIPGLEILQHADLAVFFIRFRTLPEEQFRHIRNYIEKGKPVIGLRTSTHGFLYPQGHPLEQWNTRFGIEVLGAPWIKHYGHSSSTDVFIAPKAKNQPILFGISDNFHVRSWLYYVLPYPPKDRSEILLFGKSVNPELQPGEQAVINPVAWTFKNDFGGRTFTTTMGHPEDFQVPAFRKLLINGIHWALGISPNLIQSPKNTPNHSPESIQTQKDWIPLTPIEKMAQNEYDVIIVGSGAGGGAVLWRLCEQWRRNGKRIGIIESGPLLLPTHGRNIATFNQERFVRFFENPKHTEFIGKNWENYSGAKIIRALGGRTLQWYLMSPRLLPEQFWPWPINYKDILPYYQIAEEIMNVNSAYAIGSSIQKILLQRLRSGGFPDATAIPLAFDREVTKFGQVHSNVFFSSILFLAYALKIRPFDLAVNTHAVQVLIDNGKAAGVIAKTSDNKSYQLNAKTVVLSCGTWETPRLLLQSGVPGKAIGHYLVNHPTVIVDAKGAREQFPDESGVASLMIPHPDNKKLLIEGLGTDPVDYYWYAYQEKPLLNELSFRFFGLVTTEPQDTNRVYLDQSTKDQYGMPRVQVDFSYSNQDQIMIQEMFKFMENAVNSMHLELYSGQSSSSRGGQS